MTEIFFKLTKAQIKQMQSAVKSKTSSMITLSPKQVASSSITPVDEFLPLPMNKMQMGQYARAKANMREFKYALSHAAMVRRGGFIPLIIAALSAMAPGLFNAAPPIISSVKDGYENLGNLAGVKLGSGDGGSLNIHGSAYGGWLPFLGPALMASVPSFAKNSEEIANRFVAGYDFLKPKGSGITGGNIEKGAAPVNDFVSGSSLKIFGEGVADVKKKRTKMPANVNY